MEAPQPDPNPNIDFVARMADEGIPVLAIARATSIPSSDVYQLLGDALLQGKIIEMPKDDWPPGSRRADRGLCFGTTLDTEDGLQTAITRFFKTSPLQTAMFTMLMRREKATKGQLHSVVEGNRDPQKEPTEIKIVDVLICNLRKKLNAHQIKIETLWGNGYYIPKTQKKAVIDLLLTLDAL